MTDEPGIDTSTAHTARVWNYWLGGKDHYPIDRQVGEEILRVMPDLATIARAQRYFLARAVRYLAGEAGIRQFLDVGTGLPTVDNTHEIAQRVAPEARVVYVDNDPLVLAHAQALLTSTREGACAYIDADLREPEAILREAARTLDLTRPVALMLMGVLGHVIEDGDAAAIVERLMKRLPSGSHLVVCDGTNVVRSRENMEAVRLWNQSADPPYRLRTPQELTRFFDGLELVDPGVVTSPRWRPEPSPFGTPDALDSFGGVARKP